MITVIIIHSSDYFVLVSENHIKHDGTEVLFQIFINKCHLNKEKFEHGFGQARLITVLALPPF